MFLETLTYNNCLYQRWQDCGGRIRHCPFPEAKATSDLHHAHQGAEQPEVQSFTQIQIQIQIQIRIQIQIHK